MNWLTVLICLIASILFSQFHNLCGFWTDWDLVAQNTWDPHNKLYHNIYHGTLPVFSPNYTSVWITILKVKIKIERNFLSSRLSINIKKLQKLILRIFKFLKARNFFRNNEHQKQPSNLYGILKLLKYLR